MSFVGSMGHFEIRSHSKGSNSWEFEKRRLF